MGPGDWINLAFLAVFAATVALWAWRTVRIDLHQHKRAVVAHSFGGRTVEVKGFGYSDTVALVNELEDRPAERTGTAV